MKLQTPGEIKTRDNGRRTEVIDLSCVQRFVVKPRLTASMFCGKSILTAK